MRGYLKENVDVDADSLLFATYRGTMMRYNSWRVTHVDGAVKAVGLEHVATEATDGTWVADRHGVMAAVKRLGHSNASVVTRHYARAVEARDSEIAKGFGREAPQPAPGEPGEPDED